MVPVFIFDEIVMKDQTHMLSVVLLNTHTPQIKYNKIRINSMSHDDLYNVLRNLKTLYLHFK